MPASQTRPSTAPLLAWAGLPLDQFDTLAVIRNHHYWVRSDAVFFEGIAMSNAAQLKELKTPTFLW